ncbi:uncharacterized protein LOC119650261 isoform X1 [Hermetia illucens]|uniref:uncharacterized protein LOC119650261 isoform X1 n=1 Tax=Hermetia illucens TaxID=343691 RepID=UPI0018CC6D3F|nr:uncharacterized protein LOC119650261 isoform X1 [Hermetia illucens]
MEFWWIHHSTARSYIILPWPYMYAAKGSDDISLKTLALSAYARFTRFSHNIVFFITARRRLLFSYSRPTLRTIEDDRVDHTIQFETVGNGAVILFLYRTLNIECSRVTVSITRTKTNSKRALP